MAKSIISKHTYTLINALSDPVLLIDRTGQVIAKNHAFESHSSHVSFNLLSLDQLSKLLSESFKDSTFPLSTETDIIESVLEAPSKHQYYAYLYPFVFNSAHLVIVKPLNKKETLLQQVLDCVPSRVFWKDVNSRFLGANRLFLSDCGLENQEQLIGLNDYDFFLKDEADSSVADDKQVIASGEAKLNIEESQTKPDGNISWLLTSKVPIRNQDQEVIGVMASYQDITERKIYQQLIEKQARRDQLTGLNNRQALLEYFQKLDQETGQKLGGLVFIDLDNFKTVNDTLGHTLGDRVLETVSERIVELADITDFVARLGGDEFAVLFMSKEPDQKEQLIKEVNAFAIDLKNAILEPYQIDTNHIQLGASIGITFFQSDHIDWMNILHEADMAMYEAKAAGQNSIKVFSEDIRIKHDNLGRMQSMLNQAIEKNELSLQIQPQFDCQHRIIGAEALLRWHNPILGDVPPSEFIPVCEKSGVIHSIGMWVFEQAFRMIYSWSSQYGVDNIPPLSVNVSVKQFQSESFLEHIQALLKKYPIEPRLINFELTESLLVQSEVNAIDKLKVLSELGFPLAIDDFGTGYSCLSYLNQLPINKIKIDKSFTLNVADDKRQATVVETIIAMGKNLNMSVIAEGVETKLQLDFLLAHGCFEFQGYYFSRPIDEKDYQSLIEENLNL